MLPEVEIFGITLETYLIWATIATFAGLVCAWFRAEKYKLSFVDMIFFGIIGAAGLIVGARFVFFLTEIPNIIQNGMDYALDVIKTGGIVFYGGVLGLVGGMYLFAKTKNYNVRNVMNWLAPCIPLFHGISRIGCFYAGCCYGKEASWGIILPYVQDPIKGTPRIPTQLFEVGFNLLLFIALLIYEKQCTKKNKELDLIPIYFGSYAVFRFINEFFRGDAIRGVWFGISTSQWIAMIIMAVLVYYYFKKDKKKKAVLALDKKPKDLPPVKIIDLSEENQVLQNVDNKEQEEKVDNKENDNK